MNQVLSQIQELKENDRKQRVLHKANFLVLNRKVRRSSCVESCNIWMVGSYSTAKKRYVVKYEEDLNAFYCACKAFEFSRDASCLHVLAVAIFEGGGPL